MLPIGKMLLIGKMLPIGQMLLIGKMLPIGRMLLIFPAPAVGAAPHDKWVVSTCLEAEEKLSRHITAEHRSCKWTL
jgi:hypothetical protein